MYSKGRDARMPHPGNLECGILMRGLPQSADQSGTRRQFVHPPFEGAPRRCRPAGCSSAIGRRPTRRAACGKGRRSSVQGGSRGPRRGRPGPRRCSGTRSARSRWRLLVAGRLRPVPVTARAQPHPVQLIPELVDARHALAGWPRCRVVHGPAPQRSSAAAHPPPAHDLRWRKRIRGGVEVRLRGVEVVALPAVPIRHLGGTNFIVALGTHGPELAP